MEDLYIIDVETCHHAVHALIQSKLNYFNSLYTVLSAKDRRKLDQNQAARLVFCLGPQTHTSSSVEHILFKACLQN